MGIKDLTTKELKQMKAVLKLFEFYGLSEADIKLLPKVLADYKNIASQEDLQNKKIDNMVEGINKNNEAFDRRLNDVKENVDKIANSKGIKLKDDEKEDVSYDRIVEVDENER